MAQQGINPADFATMMATFSVVLDMMEGMVSQAMERGYSEESARELVSALVSQKTNGETA